MKNEMYYKYAMYYKFLKHIKYIYLNVLSDEINLYFFNGYDDKSWQKIKYTYGSSLKETRWIDNDGLQHIGIPPNITKIDTNLFQYSKLTKHWQLSQKITYICDYAFMMSYITNVILPNIKVIKKSVFLNCKHLVNVEINTIERIEYQPFKNCCKLKNMILPDTLIYIGESAFDNTKFNSVIIPKNVNYIGEHAFSNCKYLKCIVFNNKLKKEGTNNNCFYNTYLTNVYFGYENAIMVRYKSFHYSINNKYLYSSCIKNAIFQTTSLYRYRMKENLIKMCHNKGDFTMKNRIMCNIKTLCGDKIEFRFSVEHYKEFHNLKNSIINNIDHNLDIVIHKYIKTVNNFKDIELQQLNINLESITTKQDVTDPDKLINYFNIIVNIK